MDFKSIIEYLQSRSDKTKNQITIVTAIIVVILFGWAWAANISGSLSGLDKEDFLPDNNSVKLSEENNITVEAAETKNGKTYIYFKVENKKDDILTFAKPENIAFKTEKESVAAEKITDRQNQVFITKVLSRTTNYGVLVFPEIITNQPGELLFDEMYFEQAQNYLFKEQIPVDLKTLKPVGELRS